MTRLDKVFRSAMTDAGSVRGPRSVAISASKALFGQILKARKSFYLSAIARVAEWFKAPVLKFAEAVSVSSGCVWNWWGFPSLRKARGTAQCRVRFRTICGKIGSNAAH